MTLALLLGACGNLPRPFQPDDKAEDNPLLILHDRAGVVVRPVHGLDEESSRELAERLAQALRQENVVATTGRANAASFILEGAATRAPSGAPAARLELRSPDGGAVREELVMLALPSQAGGLDFVAAARAAAAAFAPALQPQAVAISATRTAVKIGPVRGAPGEGGHALARALDNALRRSGVAVADPSDPESLIVEGTIAIAPKSARLRAVDVVWTVLRPDGDEVGQIRQENDVPAELIERAWAEMAAAVAEGAAEGIADLIERAPPPAKSQP